MKIRSDNAAAYRLGIDAGGTSCRARLTDASGRPLGEGTAGAANIGLGVATSQAAILQATHHALKQAGLPDAALARIDAGLGLAGANVPRLREAFERSPLPFRTTAILSDAEVACLGAHHGTDGGILILGTGSQGVVHRNGRFDTVGGWGFAASDSGSGAVLGRAAVRRSLLAHEGVEASSRMTAEVMERFSHDPATLAEWAAAAKPGDWGRFAPLVFEHAALGDEVAQQLVISSAAAAERMLDRMMLLGARRICLMGGVAQATRRYMSSRFDSVLQAPQGDAMDGALLLAASIAQA